MRAVYFAMMIAAFMGTTSIAHGMGRSRSTFYAAATNGPLFQIDCSRFSDSETFARCNQFIQNQASRVYPAYRTITGVDLRWSCDVVQYTIYRSGDPAPSTACGALAGSAGGCSPWPSDRICVIHYDEQWSIRDKYSPISHEASRVGPYDTHELLHHVNYALTLGYGTSGFLPDNHSLFGPTQLMATSMIEGADSGAYRDGVQISHNSTDGAYAYIGTPTGWHDYTSMETYVENDLFLADPNVARKIYLQLFSTPRTSHDTPATIQIKFTSALYRAASMVDAEEASRRIYMNRASWVRTFFHAMGFEIEYVGFWGTGMSL